MLKKTLILTAAMLFSTNLFCVNVNVHNNTKSMIWVQTFNSENNANKRETEFNLKAGGVATFDAGEKLFLGKIPTGVAGDCQVKWGMMDGSLPRRYCSEKLISPLDITIKDNGAYSTLDRSTTPLWAINHEGMGK